MDYSQGSAGAHGHGGCQRVWASRLAMQPPNGPAADTAEGRFPWRRWLWISLAILIAAAGTGVALGVAHVSRLAEQTPGPQALRDAQQMPRPSVVLSADGVLLATLREAQQEPVPLSRIAPDVMRALVATEDHRFFEHRGVDVRRTLSALVHTAIGRHARRLHDHAAARAQPVPEGDRPRAQPRPQGEGDRHGDAHRGPVLEERDHRDLSQHHALPLQRGRHRDGRAHVLRQAGRRAATRTKAPRSWACSRARTTTTRCAFRNARCSGATWCWH